MTNHGIVEQTGRHSLRSSPMIRARTKNLSTWRPISLLGVALAASLALVACGSDDDAADTTAAANTESTAADVSAADASTAAADAADDSGPANLSLVAYSVAKSADQAVQ